MQEIWKSIPNTNNQYEVSNMGNIRSLRFGKIKVLKSTKNSRGYLAVTILGKVSNVHRLILKTFKPILNEKELVVNHIDGDKTNNNLNNLEWCTQKYNILHSSKMGKHHIFSDYEREKSKDKRLNSIRKKVLCIETNEIFESISAAAKAKNTYVQNICHCCKKKLNSAGGYHWEYAA